ncbi:MAG: histidine phosphatase family protein [Pseudonocardia sp.]|nr:histidine phosphatase family protein [Pseudonocardia sp.]MBO0872913.1 histidine phosphatase family protein [Pseudonocardia sp.]
MTLRRLVLVRHGETDFNAEGRMQGHLDSELTQVGLAQARRVAPALARFKPARLLSSDLSRAARTAEEIGLVCGLPVELDTRLRETHLGEWQGLTVAQVEVGWPGALDTWRADPTWSPPGGESRVAVAARAMPLVEQLAAEFAEEPPMTVLLCAHGGLISALTCALLGLDPASWTALGGLGNARWATVRRRPAPTAPWRLTSYNVGIPD